MGLKKMIDGYAREAGVRSLENKYTKGDEKGCKKICRGNTHRAISV
jgi:ATP-dependent Lon protease